jgi:hypothetical protein
MQCHKRDTPLPSHPLEPIRLPNFRTRGKISPRHPAADRKTGTSCLCLVADKRTPNAPVAPHPKLRCLGFTDWKGPLLRRDYTTATADVKSFPSTPILRHEHRGIETPMGTKPLMNP